MKTNQFELSGFVGNIPELRFTPDGKSVATFSLYTQGALCHAPRDLVKWQC